MRFLRELDDAQVAFTILRACFSGTEMKFLMCCIPLCLTATFASRFDKHVTTVVRNLANVQLSEEVFAELQLLLCMDNTKHDTLESVCHPRAKLRLPRTSLRFPRPQWWLSASLFIWIIAGSEQTIVSVMGNSGEIDAEMISTALLLVSTNNSAKNALEMLRART